MFIERDVSLSSKICVRIDIGNTSFVESIQPFFLHDARGVSNEDYRLRRNPS